MTTEEKFHAAVNVIRNLPKHGAYVPSSDVMLRFYSYYKQATEGPCQLPKPGFWDLVKRAKWDAWTRLGNMSCTEAMNNYVEELKRIVETMSYTDNVATFLNSLDTFYESVPAADLELLIGPVLDRMRSQPGSPLSSSPLASRETSPNRVCNTSRHITSSLETSPASSHSASPLPPDTDGEEEEFIDTVESAPDKVQKDTTKASTSTQKLTVAASSTGANMSVLVKENLPKLTNGYVDTNEQVDTMLEIKQERGRQRLKKDEKLSGVTRINTTNRAIMDPYTLEMVAHTRMLTTDVHYANPMAIYCTVPGISNATLSSKEAVISKAVITLLTIRDDITSLYIEV
ncbi:hypothetical protein KM043_011340 [Ampulex compressa]|nr:hypothetical protein KM043_011340 [Ampulex compressa]